MTRHVTVRMAWHDNKWNGRICRDPDANIHCIGNYSLLSSRIQRRRRSKIETSYRDREISKIIEEQGYVPPCYWSINAFGSREYTIADHHPFADIGSWKERFSKEVPEIEEKLKPYSVFTWYFRLGYAKEGSLDRYVPREELKERVEGYLGDIQAGKSIALLYANYSNPITGDNHKYLLLGAGLAREVTEPKEFNIPDKLFNDITARRRMRNMPRILWRFQLALDPDTLFLLPYHEYLEYIEESGLDSEEEWKKLEDVAIPIRENTIIRNFKYVCRPLSSSKCLYTLYLIERSVRKMKEHGIIEHSHLKDIEIKLDSLLEIAWRERGKHPGFRNLIQRLLSATYPPFMQSELALEIQQLIGSKFGNIENFLKTTLKEDDYGKIPVPLRKAFRIIERNKALVKFLSLFDFSKKQFDNILDIVDSQGLETVKRNPYILLENYVYDSKDDWRIDESDYGVALFQIDMALIPDPRYADWDFQYDALSPERLRSVVTTILYDTAMHEGISYLSREEIVDRIKEYPLYYIHEGLKVDVQTLSKYEKQALFKEKLSIKQEFPRQNVLYQLKVIRNIERIIEQFVKHMAKKKHSVSDKVIKKIEAIVRKERTIFKEKLDTNERKILYKNALGNGLFVLTGKAGSGKTTAIKNLVASFKDDRKLPVFIFTPTGKASLVVKDRLRELDYDETQIKVSTIHRFLFTAPFEYKDTLRYKEIYKIRNLIERILSGKLELLDDFKSTAKSFNFTPKVVIIDEVSMVDEVLLALLFSLINTDTLEHLILVGDEKQLPPIGIGRPLTDIVFNLKKTALDSNLIHLESNLRFDTNTSLGSLTELIIGEDPPIPMELQEIFENPDETIEMKNFSNLEDLRDIIKGVLAKTSNTDTTSSVFEMFRDVLEENGTLNLDRIQILTPRKYGSFGCEAINIRGVLEGEPSFMPGTKLICEENIYHSIGPKRRRKRILGLANGSIGYIKNSRDVFFEDIEDLVEEYGPQEIYGLKNKIIQDIYSPLKSQTRINFGYTITVHKSQGSDFFYVIFVLSDVSPFITKELIYTALTRPREKIYLVTHADLTKDLPSIFAKAFSNSEVEKRKTLLFGHKDSPFKPYYLTKKNGETIQVMSKIEYIIAKVLDEAQIVFEPGPQEFLRKYHLIPDFKLSVAGENYYWEHLGNMKNLNYRERWYRKFKTYRKEIGIADRLITTSENQKRTDTEKAIRKVIDHLKSKRLAKTEGTYSFHHYYI